MSVKERTDVKSKRKLKHPRLYMVIFWNDKVTTAEFVERMLMTIFDKSSQDAKILTRKVDTEGMVVAGVYLKDIAYTKRDEVLIAAKKEKFPFEVTVELVDNGGDED